MYDEQIICVLIYDTEKQEYNETEWHKQFTCSNKLWHTEMWSNNKIGNSDNERQEPWHLKIKVYIVHSQ
jgi:hypothetical protein